MDDGEETFTVLSSMMYKNSTQTISSILICDITTHATVEGDDAFGETLCNILSRHWNRCLLEELVGPDTCTAN